MTQPRNTNDSIKPECWDKERHASRKTAIKAAKRDKRRFASTLRVYYCSDCRGWHKATVKRRARAARI